MTLRLEVDVALDLIDEAAETAVALRGRAESWAKADGSVVTSADVAVERLLVDGLRRRFPQDGVIAEEDARVDGTSGRDWVVDPIDGTSTYATDGPAWGTHLALVHEGEVVLGVISRPDLGRCVWADRNRGAFRRSLGSRSDERLQVSGRDASRARVGGLLEQDGVVLPGLRDRGLWTPSDFVVEDLASGRIDAFVDDAGHVWDQAPAVAIVEAAGGRFTDDSGGRLLTRRFGLYSNGPLHPWLTDLVSELRG